MNEEKKKKVGIITLYYRNFNLGGMLQAYALQHVVEKQGYECEQISYDRLADLPSQKGKAVRNYVSSLYRTIKKWPHTIATRKRRKNFALFQDRIPHSEKIYSSVSMRESNEVYDAFICGSDQIWNDWGASQEEVNCNTLKFAPTNVPKIAYAVSTGTVAFTEAYKEKIKVGLKELSAISLREKSAVPMIEEISGKKVEVMADPVLLLKKEDWDEVAEQSRCKNEERYVLGYFLSGNQEYEVKTIQVAQEMNAKAIFLPFDGTVKKSKSSTIKYDYFSGPAEFVQLIKNAELILTDSFHAALFSAIFHKKFYVFLRNTKVQGITMNSRILDFLKEYELEERLADKGIFPEKSIDYAKVDEKIGIRRNESIEFLMNALENK